MKLAKVERKGTYQGVPQWGITGSAEITPSRATAEKWARLENAAKGHTKTPERRWSIWKLLKAEHRKSQS